MKQIEAHVPIMIACGGSKTEALDDILAREILRKLEQLSPAYVKSEANGLVALLDELCEIVDYQIFRSARKAYYIHLI